MKNWLLLLLFPLVSMASHDEKSKDYQWDKYGILCITNNLDFAMNYSYRWGNGAWQNISLPPGYNQSHWYEYPSHHTISPHFTINFDHDPTSWRHYTTYSLDRYKSSDTSCDNAKKYVFKEDSENNKIDLYSKN